MSIKIKLAKALMKMMPSKPEFDLSIPRAENINHEYFLNATRKEKDKILFNMAKNHYISEQKKPFDHYFSDYPIEKLLSGKRVLDLGCWCGGKSVSCAERWDVEKMHGIDVSESFIRAARLFSSSRKKNNIKYEFKMGFGESIPYEADRFDAIVSWDVLEHVRSVKKTLTECKRTLTSEGQMFLIFPSYYCPFGGQHLNLVTNTPCLNWFCEPKTINEAFHDILNSRGEESYWYRSSDKSKDEWRTLHGGIGINGTTFEDFNIIVDEIGFSKVDIISTPLFSVGATSLKYPQIKFLSKLIRPLLKFNSLKDYLSHRIVAYIRV